MILFAHHNQLPEVNINECSEITRFVYGYFNELLEKGPEGLSLRICEAFDRHHDLLQEPETEFDFFA